MKKVTKKIISSLLSLSLVIIIFFSALETVNAVGETASGNISDYIDRYIGFDTYTPTEGNYWGDPTTWAYSSNGSITWSIADGVLKYTKDASGNDWNCVWNDFAFYNIMKLNETGANLNSDDGTIKLTPGKTYNVNIRLNLNLTNKSANEDIGLYLGVGTSDKLSDNVTTADGNWTCTINGGMLLDRFSASTGGWVNKTYKITVPADAGEGGLLLGITPIANTGDGSTFSAYTYSCFELDIDSVRVNSGGYSIGFEKYTPTEGDYWNYPTTWAYSSDGSITWSVADGVLKYTKDASGNNWNCIWNDWAFYNIMKLNEMGANLNTDAGTFKLVPGATYNVSVRLNLNLTNKNANEDIGLYLGVGTSDKLSDNVTTADGNWSCTINGGMLLDRFSASTEGWVNKTYKITVPEDAGEGGLLLGITPISNTGDGSTFSAYTYSCFELLIDSVSIDSVKSYHIGFEKFAPTEGDYWNNPTSWAWADDGSVKWSIENQDYLHFSKAADKNDWNALWNDQPFYYYMELNEIGACTNSSTDTIKLVPGEKYTVKMHYKLENYVPDGNNSNVMLYLGTATDDLLRNNYTDLNSDAWRNVVNGAVVFDRITANTSGWVERTYLITIPVDAGYGSLLLGIASTPNTDYSNAEYTPYNWTSYDLYIDDVQIDSYVDNETTGGLEPLYHIGFENYNPHEEGDFWTYPSSWANGTTTTWSIDNSDYLHFSKKLADYSEQGINYIMKLNSTGAHLNSDSETIKLKPGGKYAVQLRYKLENYTPKSDSKNISIFLGVGKADLIAGNYTGSAFDPVNMNGSVLLKKLGSNTDGWVEETFYINIPENAGEGSLLLAVAPKKAWDSDPSYRIYSECEFDFYIDEVNIYSQNTSLFVDNYDGRDAYLSYDDASVLGDLKEPVRSGYIFKGFSLEKNSETVGADTLLLKNLNMVYAIWEAKPVTDEYEDLENHIAGDINDDNSVNVLDLVRLKEMSSGATEYTWAADINGDRIIEPAVELTEMKQMLLGSEAALQQKGDRVLVWSDEFKSYELDPDKWGTINLSDTVAGLTLDNSEKSISVSKGSLSLAVNRSDSGYIAPYHVTTQHTMQFKYGYVEMRAKIPMERGLAASFWAKGDTAYQTASGMVEVDIFETFASNDTIHPNLHIWDGDIHADMGSPFVRTHYTFNDSSNLSDEYHIYGFEWTETGYKFSVDGYVYCEYTFDEILNKWGYEDEPVFHDPQYLILGMHPYLWDMDWLDYPSGITSDTVLPAEYQIDWIRLYQNPETETIYSRR